MKFTDIGMLFSIVFLCFLVVQDSTIRDLAAIQKVQLQYNTAFDGAVQDALYQTVEVDSGRSVILNKKEVLKNFFHSLWINMGIMEENQKKRKMLFYIPVLSFVEERKFTIFYYDVDKEGTYCYQEKEFFYPYQEKEMTVYFTLSDYIYLEDKNGTIIEGKYQDIKKEVELELFSSQERFQQVRRNTIITLLQDRIKFYLNEHNKIAKKYGITYEFALPVIEEEEWYRTIDNISLLAFFQGYPYGNKQTGFYNRVAIGGARVLKAKIETQEE